MRVVSIPCSGIALDFPTGLEVMEGGRRASNETSCFSSA